MITPQQYENWPLPLEQAAEEVANELLRDIVRRLWKEGRITATAYIQTQSLIDYSGLSMEDINKRLSDMTGLLDSEIEKLYQKAVEQMQTDYGAEIEKLGKPSRFLDNAYTQGLVRAEAMQTRDTFTKLTGSFGFSVELSGRAEWVPLERVYHRALDHIIQQVQSGGFTIDQAIRQASVKLADSGLQTIDYASGHSDRVEVAVRRAAVTGMHQISGRMSEAAIDELGTNLVEVSAHTGARDKGDVPENHQLWQGKVYWWKEKGGEPPNGNYPDFITTTGYDTGPGLKGWNCRHDFGPFIEGVSQRIWTDEELANIDPPPFEYEGKTYKADDALDRQREIERTIKRYKRRIMALEETGLNQHDLEYQRNAGIITAWTRKYNEFSKAAGLRPQLERAQIIGFSTGQAARVRAAYQYRQNQ